MRAPGIALVLAALAACVAPGPRDPPLELFEWQRGLGVRAQGPTPMPMYLWFYEWNLFEAFEAGEFTKGSYEFERTLAADGRAATLRGPGLELRARVERDGVALELAVENLSDHDWPELAALVACWNPGPETQRNAEMAHPFKTYTLGPAGLERVPAREMHYNGALSAALAARSPGREFAFTSRWPTSPSDSCAGLLLRESQAGGWTSGVAWERWLGVQAHNPWMCMHVATQLGPLARGERRTLRGKLYLFPGTPADGARRWKHDFQRP